MLWKKTTEWCVPWQGRCFGDGRWIWDGSTVCLGELPGLHLLIGNGVRHGPL